MGEEWDHTLSHLECLSLPLRPEPPQDFDQFVSHIHPPCLPGLRLRDLPRLETPVHLDGLPMPVDISRPGTKQFAKPHPRSECRHPEGIAVRPPSQTDGCVRKRKAHPFVDRFRNELPVSMSAVAFLPLAVLSPSCTTCVGVRSRQINGSIFNRFHLFLRPNFSCNNEWAWF